MILRETFCEDGQTAFTLAEVLVTLGIIGVVAAMTLPSVIATHKKHEAEARLKKVYSTLNQAFLAAQAKHGEAKYWPEWDDAEVILEMYFAPELNSSKLYGKAVSVTKAMCYDGKNPNLGIVNPDGKPVSGYQYSWMTNVYISYPFYEHETASIKLMDGSCVGLNPDITLPHASQKTFLVDINGSNRAPNKAGYDLFFFVVDDNSIRPYGHNFNDINRDSGCNKDVFASGKTCAAKIMSDNWTIKYW